MLKFRAPGRPNVHLDDLQLIALIEKGLADSSLRGFLHKRSTTNPKWRLKWFLLFENLLFYFDVQPEATTSDEAGGEQAAAATNGADFRSLSSSLNLIKRSKQTTSDQQQQQWQQLDAKLAELDKKPPQQPQVPACELSDEGEAWQAAAAAAGRRASLGAPSDPNGLQAQRQRLSSEPKARPSLNSQPAATTQVTPTTQAAATLPAALRGGVARHSSSISGVSGHFQAANEQQFGRTTTTMAGKLATSSNSYASLLQRKIGVVFLEGSYCERIGEAAPTFESAELAGTGAGQPHRKLYPHRSSLQSLNRQQAGGLEGDIDSEFNCVFSLKWKRQGSKGYEFRCETEQECLVWVEAISQARYSVVVSEKEQLEQRYLHLSQIIESETTAKWHYARQCEECLLEIKKLQQEVCLLRRQEGRSNQLRLALCRSAAIVDALVRQQRRYRALALAAAASAATSNQLTATSGADAATGSRSTSPASRLGGRSTSPRADNHLSRTLSIEQEQEAHEQAVRRARRYNVALQACQESLRELSDGPQPPHSLGLAVASAANNNSSASARERAMQALVKPTTTASQDDLLALEEQERLSMELKSVVESLNEGFLLSDCALDAENSEEMRKIKKVQGFFRGWLCRRRWKQIVQEYIKSPHAESMRKRNNLVFRMVECEEEYVEQLTLLVTAFLRPLKMTASSQRPALSHDEFNSIFLNAETLLFLHQIFLKGLTARMESWPTLVLGDLFNMLLPMLTIYQEYVRNHHFSLQVLAECKQRDQFTQILKRLEETKPQLNGRTLETFLTYPMHQIPRYIICLHEILAHTPHNHVERENLYEAQTKLEELSRQMHDEVSETEHIRQNLAIERMIIGGCDFLLDVNQVFVRQGILLQSPEQPAQKGAQAGGLAKTRSCLASLAARTVGSSSSASSQQAATSQQQAAGGQQKFDGQQATSGFWDFHAAQLAPPGTPTSPPAAARSLPVQPEQHESHHKQEQQQHHPKELVRQCFLFTNHLLICTRTKDGKLQLLQGIGRVNMAEVTLIENPLEFIQQQETLIANIESSQQEQQQQPKRQSVAADGAPPGGQASANANNNSQQQRQRGHSRVEFADKPSWRSQSQRAPKSPVGEPPAAAPSSTGGRIASYLASKLSNLAGQVLVASSAPPSPLNKRNQRQSAPASQPHHPGSQQQPLHHQQAGSQGHHHQEQLQQLFRLHRDYGGCDFVLLVEGRPRKPGGGGGQSQACGGGSLQAATFAIHLIAPSLQEKAAWMSDISQTTGADQRQPKEEGHRVEQREPGDADQDEEEAEGDAEEEQSKSISDNNNTNNNDSRRQNQPQTPRKRRLAHRRQYARPRRLDASQLRAQFVRYDTNLNATSLPDSYCDDQQQQPPASSPSWLAAHRAKSHEDKLAPPRPPRPQYSSKNEHKNGGHQLATCSSGSLDSCRPPAPATPATTVGKKSLGFFGKLAASQQGGGSLAGLHHRNSQASTTSASSSSYMPPGGHVARSITIDLNPGQLLAPATHLSPMSSMSLSCGSGSLSLQLSPAYAGGSGGPTSSQVQRHSYHAHPHHHPHQPQQQQQHHHHHHHQRQQSGDFSPRALNARFFHHAHFAAGAAAASTPTCSSSSTSSLRSDPSGELTIQPSAVGDSSRDLSQTDPTNPPPTHRQQQQQPHQRRRPPSQCIDNVHFNDLFHGSTVADSSSVTINHSVRTDPRLYKDDVDIKFSRALNSCKLPQIRYASKERLFERLTDLRFLSIDFLNTFLLTYRVFTTAEQVLEALKSVHYNCDRFYQAAHQQEQQQQQPSQQPPQQPASTDASRSASLVSTCAGSVATAAPKSSSQPPQPTPTAAKLEKSPQKPLVPPRARPSIGQTVATSSQAAPSSSALDPQPAKFLLTPGNHQHGKQRRSTISALTPITGSNSSSLANLASTSTCCQPATATAAAAAVAMAAAAAAADYAHHQHQHQHHNPNPRASLANSTCSNVSQDQLLLEEEPGMLLDQLLVHSASPSPRASLTVGGAATPTHLNVPGARQNRASSFSHSSSNNHLRHAHQQQQHQQPAPGQEHWRLSYKKSTASLLNVATLNGTARRASSSDASDPRLTVTLCPPLAAPLPRSVEGETATANGESLEVEVPPGTPMDMAADNQGDAHHQDELFARAQAILAKTEVAQQQRVRRRLRTTTTGDNHQRRNYLEVLPSGRRRSTGSGASSDGNSAGRTSRATGASAPTSSASSSPFTSDEEEDVDARGASSRSVSGSLDQSESGLIQSTSGASTSATPSPSHLAKPVERAKKPMRRRAKTEGCYIMKEIELNEAKVADCDTSADEDKILSSSEEDLDDDDDGDADEADNNSPSSDGASFRLLAQLNSVRLDDNNNKSRQQVATANNNNNNGNKSRGRDGPPVTRRTTTAPTKTTEASNPPSAPMPQPNKAAETTTTTTTPVTTPAAQVASSIPSGLSSRITTPRSSFQHGGGEVGGPGGATKAGVVISSTAPRVSSRRSSTASAASAFAAATAASSNPLLTGPPPPMRGHHQQRLSSRLATSSPHVELAMSTSSVAEVGYPCPCQQMMQQQQQPHHQRGSVSSAATTYTPTRQVHYQQQHYHHPSCPHLQQHQQQQQSLAGSPVHHHDYAGSLYNSRASSRLSSNAGLELAAYGQNQTNNFFANWAAYNSAGGSRQQAAYTPTSPGGVGGRLPGAGGARAAGGSICSAFSAGSSMATTAAAVGGHRHSINAPINVRSVATIRVLSVLRHWVSKHSQDFVGDSKLASMVQDFLHDLLNDASLLPAEHKAALQLQQMVQKAATSPQVDFDLLLAPPVRPSLENCETLSALEIAEAMTYLDHKIFLAIRSEEFLGQAWMKMDKAIKAPHILLITKRFNDVSRLVSSEIIRVADINRRVAVIEKWANVAHICRVVHNFNGVLQICAAFTNSAVFRLKKTWEKIPKTTKTIVDQLQNLVSTDSRFRNMRDAINRCDPPSIPYVGMYLTDLSFIEEGTPNYSPDGLLNFSKMRMIAHVIREIQHLQNGSYKIELKPKVAHYLLDESRFLQDDEMYRCSLAIEPKSVIGKTAAQQVLNNNSSTTTSGAQTNTAVTPPNGSQQKGCDQQLSAASTPTHSRSPSNHHHQA